MFPGDQDLIMLHLSAFLRQEMTIFNGGNVKILPVNPETNIYSPLKMDGCEDDLLFFGYVIFSSVSGGVHIFRPCTN